jgi:hypothetical protein
MAENTAVFHVLTVYRTVALHTAVYTVYTGIPRNTRLEIVQMGSKQRRLDYKEVGVEGDSSPNLDHTNSGVSLHATSHASDDLTFEPTSAPVS